MAAAAGRVEVAGTGRNFMSARGEEEMLAPKKRETGLAVSMQYRAKWLRSRFLGKARSEEGAYRDEDL